MEVKHNIIFKYIILYVLFIATGVAILVQIMRIQIMDGKRARAELQKRSLKKVDVLAQRGDILSHDGQVLVTSMQKYELYYDFAAVKRNADFDSSIDSIARGLAAILKDRTASEYALQWRRMRLEALKKKTHRYYQITKKRVDYNILQQIKKLPLLGLPQNKGGLIVKAKIERIYPYGQLALHTLGWVNAAQGGVGIEFSYQDDIAGKAGWEWQQRIDRNTFAPVSSEPEQEPINGCDVISAIDLDLQQIVEEAVRSKLISSEDLDWGCAALMDVKTGEVRAIANKRKVQETGEIVEDDNYALRYRKDPGSTFKLVSFMIMLEKGLDLNETVDTKKGAVTIYDKTYEDEGSQGGVLTAMQVFEKSSNVGTIELTKLLYPHRRNWDDFLDRIDAMKIREITDFDIKPQQDITPVIYMRHNDGIALYAMSMGTALELTPLQTLTIYNAIANNGCMVHPFFIKEIRTSDGKIKTKHKSGKVINKSLCSQKTIDKLQQMLINVVEHGTAQQAKSAILAIAGKTGTAHIAEGSSGYSNKKLASFAGYFPADKPRYSCIVAFRTIETPAKTYGGRIAAPVFKTIAEKVYARSAHWQTPIAEYADVIDAPFTKSGMTAALYRALDCLALPAISESSSEWATTAAIDGKVVLQPRALVAGLVPDVRNMGLKDAVYLLESSGLKVAFEGRGTVLGQSPEAGSPCTRGSRVSLRMSVED